MIDNNITVTTFHSVETYKRNAESLNFVLGSVLFGFAKYECNTKDQIIRNFVAKSSMTIKAIFTLWDDSNYQDAWALHRTLLDRYFHLYAIGVSNDFEEFEEWSFFEQYKSLNKLLSDHSFKQAAKDTGHSFTAAQKQRAKSLEQNKPSWRRPKAENVAKDLGLMFLYKYGYDYASTHVHPMANDGEQDFHTITQLEPSHSYPSQIALLSNTILIATMLLQEALNRSGFSWCKALFDYLDQLRISLKTGDHNYEAKLLPIEQLLIEGRLCQKLK